jgi:ABC-type phosphate/phosphonate transport system substrate-binding protein
MSESPLIACSRMYNVAPVVTAAWDRLFRWLQERTGVELEVIYHAFPTPIEELWALPGLGCVLMCGYPYARAEPRPQLLAAPVPSFEHYKGKPVYFSYLLVGEDSPFETIEDTYGGRISWTIENSQSGFNAIRSFLLPYRTVEQPLLYRESIGPIGTFSVGIEGIRNGEIDVVPVDSFSYDLMREYAPEDISGTRIIATTPSAPMPPLVAGHDVDEEVAGRLRSALFAAHEVPELAEALAVMKITRFVPVTPDYYETTLEQAAEAVAAGYLQPS